MTPTPIDEITRKMRSKAPVKNRAATPVISLRGMRNTRGPQDAMEGSTNCSRPASQMSTRAAQRWALSKRKAPPGSSRSIHQYRTEMPAAADGRTLAFAMDAEPARPRSWAEPGAVPTDFLSKPLAAPTRSRQFLQTVGSLDTKKLGAAHRNLQELVRQRFKNTRQAFRAFQEQLSGQIGFVEFQRFLARQNFLQGLGHEYHEGLFALLDDNGDGKIDYQEFCRWVKEPDKHENIMVGREDPYAGERGGMSFLQRTEWIRSRIGSMCE